MKGNDGFKENEEGFMDEKNEEGCVVMTPTCEASSAGRVSVAWGLDVGAGVSVALTLVLVFAFGVAIAFSFPLAPFGVGSVGVRPFLRAGRETTIFVLLRSSSSTSCLAADCMLDVEEADERLAVL